MFLRKILLLHKPYLYKRFAESREDVEDDGCTGEENIEKNGF